MIFFSDAETFFKMGNFSISWSLVLLGVGIYLCFMISREILKKEGTSYSLSEDLFVGTLFFGLLASRLFYCAYNLKTYLPDPIRIIQLSDGGFSFAWGFWVGLIFVFVYCRMNRLSLLRIADAIVPNIFLIGMMISVRFESGKKVEESILIYLKNGITVESILLFIGFLLISVVYRRTKKRKRGDLTYASLIGLSLVSLLTAKPHGIRLVLDFALMGVGIVGMLGFIDKAIKKQKPVLLFDLDGTLLDTQPAIFYSFTKLFEHYAPNVEVNQEILNSVLGPPLEASIQKYFPKEDTKALVTEYREYNIEAHKTLVKPMPKCQELLKACREEGFRMAIISAKRKDIVELGCKQCGILDYFEVILGSDEVTKHKPDPQGLLEACRLMKVSKDNAVYVGDSPTDIQAAQNAGMFAIGYFFNPARKQALIDSKPNACVDDLMQIKEILKEDHAWTTDLM